ncbi:hypothetical protein [Methylobacter tundripaludum]|uniref:hypothetical protein n=1 Tax=Methylobacter tundripaludum TaxID=173365 RepID=UPI00048997D3|nr:hypothetical protein [Methylobacter tundripaludum]
MNNLLNNWINRRKLQRCVLKAATLEDIDFVMEQIVDGTKEGHYLDSILDPEHQANYRAMFIGLMKGQGTATMGERGIERKSGSLWIYGNNDEGNIGFFFISEKYEGSGEKEIELLMAGIKKRLQRVGHGSNMIGYFLALCPKNATLYARCYPASEAMYITLVNAGFVKINTKPGGTRELELKRT